MIVNVTDIEYKKYDYTIIGAGPSGLTISYIMGLNGFKCLLIDENKNIGGCHRADYLNDLFVEHSPRVISSAYLNFKKILNMMGSSFEEIYVPYEFSISNIGGKTLLNLNKFDVLKLSIEFIKLIFNNYHGYNVPVKKYMLDNNFNKDTIDYIDRICRLTDGGGSDRYTLYQVLQLINQQGLYKLYQPKLPNNELLFNIFEKALNKTDNVDILLNTGLSKIYKKNNKIINVDIVSNDKMININIKNLVLAITPKSIYNILLNSNITNAFTNNFLEFTVNNTYIEDIGITFHWNRKLLLKPTWGFPKSDWMIGFIISSNYTKFKNQNSKTVISCVILNVDEKSSYLNKTANEVDDEDTLKNEVFRQLKSSFSYLPDPSFKILNPRVFRNTNTKIWENKDSSYFMSYNKQKFIKFNSDIYNNLYNVGTQNGKSYYSFNSFESAVTNALYFTNTKIKNKFKIQRPREMRNIFLYGLLIISIIYLCYI